MNDLTELTDKNNVLRAFFVSLQELSKLLWLY